MKSACQHCANHLEFDAKHVGCSVECPHCNETTILTFPDEPIRESPLNRKNIIRSILALFLLGIIYSLIASALQSQKHFEEIGFQSINERDPRYKECLDAVKAELISPATVIVVEAALNQDSDEASVRFRLDSQNKYGALVRQNWLVKLSRNRSGSWTVESVKEVAR